MLRRELLSGTLASFLRFLKWPDQFSDRFLGDPALILIEEFEF